MLLISGISGEFTPESFVFTPFFHQFTPVPAQTIHFPVITETIYLTKPLL